jgi:antitoxin (DNA-binding transcriptional repressor) of toxin-antitoxin stability system
MRAVGIRELKNSLSRYIRLVEAGESVLVTDRGSVVAEIRPPGAEGQRSALDPISAELAELARRGRAVLGAAHDPDLYRTRPAVLKKGTSAELLDAERGER